MTGAAPSRPRRPGFLARFAGARRGATAVEFALVAVPFLALVFAIFDLGMMFLVSTTMESSAQDRARTLRTGQFQSSGGTAASYKAAICADLGWLTSDCNANLYVDVRTYPQFANPSTPNPVANQSFNANALTFNPGAACSIVLVRAFYQWPLLTPFLLGGLQQLSGGTALLTAASTFRVEPYGSATC